jgi:glycine/D-amino acid oxidase-like deaminating enzyme
VRLACDVAVIGGGIIGTAAAAFLAEAGRSVVLFERAELAAGASGRNSGVLQHPYDPVLAMLHHRSLELYRELAAGDAEFSMTDKPAGILLVSPDAPVVELAAAELARTVPELAPRALAGDELLALEPGLAEGLGAVLIETGYPVVPAAATLAYGRRAARAGVVIRSGIEARPVVAGGRLTGVLLRGGERVAVGQALVAAGPWSPSVVPGWTGWPPIAPTYGVVVSVRLPDAPRHVVEELGIEPGGSEVASSFSLVNAAGLSSVGSTFLLEPPDLAEQAARLMARGAMFVPALAGAERVGVRACARPVSVDGRPLIGPVSGCEGLFVCAGHGPWGMSSGPESARLVVGAMLEPEARSSIPAELSAGRWANLGSQSQGD